MQPGHSGEFYRSEEFNAGGVRTYAEQYCESVDDVDPTVIRVHENPDRPSGCVGEIELTAVEARALAAALIVLADRVDAA